MTLFLMMASAAVAQVTTSGISGLVTSNGESVIGATVTATHQPSGTVYRAVTNIDGRYAIQGMRVGGPYKVEISYIGNKPKVFNNVSLRLGETEDLSCSLQGGRTRAARKSSSLDVADSTPRRQAQPKASTPSR